jgi:aryl-alcohol dehydrogenase-like predicted oxidoreductase
MQNHYNLIYREEEREMLPLCTDQGVGVLPWSPLARGLLTGTRDRGGKGQSTRSANDPLANSLYQDDDFAVVDAVRVVAEKRELPMAQVALAWLLSRASVTAPILGATKLAHLQDGLAALEVTLTDEDMSTVEAPYRPHSVIGHS